jgi:hypothetical protein
MEGEEGCEQEDRVLQGPALEKALNSVPPRDLFEEKELLKNANLKRCTKRHRKLMS